MVEWNQHFQAAGSWAEAAALVEFRPRVPADTDGNELASLAVHVMDHRGRRLPLGERSLEAHYGRFVVDQKRVGSREEASRRALVTSYGPDPVQVTVGEHEGRRYALGPEVAEDDVDGRSPAVVVWSVEDVVCLIASAELDHPVLLRVAESMHL